MQISELLSGLAAEAGLPELVPDENGVVSLDVDGMVVIISAEADGSVVVVRGDAGYPPPDAEASLRKMLLDANMAMSSVSGCYFASDADSGRIALVASERLSCITIPDFISRMDSFLNTLETWRKVIADFRVAADSAPESAPKADESESSPLMRV